MRVIAGVFRSRRLKGTPPAGIRPTSDKLRETLFNVLGHQIDGAVFLDGYAGMGGVGFEAISRGAALVYFVDQSRKACAIIRENLQSLDVARGFRIMEMPLAKALKSCEEEGTKFDLAFLDPPYDADDLYVASLESFGNRPFLKEDGVLVLEHSKRVNLPEQTGFLRRYRSLTHGDSTLSFYARS